MVRYEYEIVIRERRENPRYEEQLKEYRASFSRYGVMNNDANLNPVEFETTRVLETVLSEEEWGEVRQAVLRQMAPKRDAPPGFRGPVGDLPVMAITTPQGNA